MRPCRRGAWPLQAATPDQAKTRRQAACGYTYSPDIAHVKRGEWMGWRLLDAARGAIVLPSWQGRGDMAGGESWHGWFGGEGKCL